MILLTYKSSRSNSNIHIIKEVIPWTSEHSKIKINFVSRGNKIYNADIFYVAKFIGVFKELN